MAKYTILMSCGHEDTVELLGKSDEREKKIKYYKSNGLCKECYKEKMQRENEEEGLVFNATVLPNIDERNGDILLSVWFDGDTRPYKDAIKSIGGYRWSERKSANDFFSATKPPLCWNKTIAFTDLKSEVQKAVSIGAKNLTEDNGVFAMVHYETAIQKQKEWMEKQEKIKSIIKPVVPEILEGCGWNQKIYGKTGNYSVYLDGEKIVITDKQAEEIREYLVKRDEYKKKIEELKNGKL